MLELKNIRNSAGSPIILNDREERQALYWKGVIKNALGYEVDITTLTGLVKKVVEQKFFEIPPADYVPIRVGEGTWGTQLTTFREFAISGDFEDGVINTGASDSKIAAADTGVDSLTVKIINWAKTIGWSIFDLEMASRSGNWDVVTSKEKSRKKNWDLGIQKIAFLGSSYDTNVKGVLTQDDVSSNATLITAYINGLSAADFNTLIKGIYEAYRANAERTVKPTHFFIPEVDYNGLINFPDSTYPLKTKLQILEESFKTITGNPNFKILPLAYADKATNAAIINKNRYVLLNYDEDTVRMDIPLDFTATMAQTLNGFTFQNVAYGQFTGVKAYRPKEILYFDWA